MSSFPLANRDQFLALSKRRYLVVQVPEYQLAFRVQSLSEGERSDFEAETLTKKGELNPEKFRDAKRRLVALCLVDQSNRPMFDADDPAELDRLRAIDGLVTGRLYEVCRQHCGFDKGDIEELVKNSSAMADDDSPTDSPSPLESGTSTASAE